MAEKNKASKDKDSLKGAEYIYILPPDQDKTIEDRASGSEGIFPIHTSPTGVITDIHIDKGMIRGLPQNSPVCDRLLNYDDQNENGIRINCFVELKGSRNADQTEHAAEQIKRTIHYADDKESHPEFAEWTNKGDLCLAVIAGAPDKTLPPLANDSAKNLCKLLYRRSGNKEYGKENLLKHVFYVKLEKRCKQAVLQGSAPMTIVCYNKTGAFAPFPELLVGAK